MTGVPMHATTAKAEAATPWFQLACQAWSDTRVPRSVSKL
jgi:hypothetical protein